LAEAPPPITDAPAPAAAGDAEPDEDEAPEKSEEAEGTESKAEEPKETEKKEESKKITEPSEGEEKSGKSAAELSFEEKKKERAKRFKIPLVETEEDLEKKKQERAKRFKMDTRGDKKGNNKRQKISQGEEELTEEEIEKRLARAKKYNVNNEQTDKLKAILRKKRFENK
jgi:hypothetical protein